MLNTQKRILENTSYYLENYLNPDSKWDKKTAPLQRINQIRYSEVCWKTVSKHIKGMEYKDFLKTPYWKAISAHTKYKVGYRCQLCNSLYNLVTHHRSYNIHGREHAHMHELIVLCDHCHNKFHDKLPKLESMNREESIFFARIFALIIFLVLAVAIYCFCVAPKKAPEPQGLWEKILGS